jgi:IS5 family transposase
MLILKHLFDWSYDDLEQEVRANLVYRAFTRIDAGEVPDAKTILKIAGALGPDVVAQLHRQVVEVATRAGVTHGRRFRIDTTVVETNVHCLRRRSSGDAAPPANRPGDVQAVRNRH